MSFFNQVLIIGCKIAYYMLDVNSYTILKILLSKCSKSTTFMMATSDHSEVLLLDTDNTIRVFDKQGLPSRSEKNVIHLSTPPVQLACLFPYLFVITNTYVVVYNVVSSQCIQVRSFFFKTVNFLSFFQICKSCREFPLMATLDLFRVTAFLPLLSCFIPIEIFIP